MNTADLKSFQYLENGSVQFTIFDTIKSTSTLDPGSYDLSYDGYPKDTVLLNKIQQQELFPVWSFPQKDKLDSLFNSFFDPNMVETIKDLRFIHKVGVLLYGKQGTGKTSIIKYYCNQVVQQNKAVVFYISGSSYLTQKWAFVLKIRAIQDNPIVIVLDEMEEMLKNPAAETEGLVKSMLDGHLSVTNSIIFGSTNYIERIPEALRDRPSRFKYSFEIEGIQSSEEVYNITKLGFSNVLEDVELKEIAEKMKGETLDNIKHACLDKVMKLQEVKIARRRIGF